MCRARRASAIWVTSRRARETNNVWRSPSPKGERTNVWRSPSPKGERTMTLIPASDAAQLAAQRELAAELPVSTSERVVVDRVLGVLERLLPGRAFAIRAADLRSRDPVRAYSRGALLRENVGAEPLVLSQGTLDRARLKGAVAASARL